MNDKKVKECILFFVCRAGMYPFVYENCISVFLEKLMKKDKLNLNISLKGNDLIEYTQSVTGEMITLDSLFTPKRDYDSKILSKDEVLVLEEILYDMIKESRKIYENSQDSSYYIDSVESNTEIRINQ